MGMTLTEKILARGAGKARVEPGDKVWVGVDVLMTHDVCGPPTYAIFQREFGSQARFWDPDRVVVIPDHYIFTEDPHARRNLEELRRMAHEQGLRYFYDAFSARYSGVCHVTLAEKGHVRPGSIIIGTDSHTCTAGAFGAFATGVGNTDAAFVLGTGKLWLRVPETLRVVLHGQLAPGVMAKDVILRLIGDLGVDGANYCALEFQGEGVGTLSVDERMTLCNMAVEAGAKNGLIPVDDETRRYLQAHGVDGGEAEEGDPTAEYAQTLEYRLDVLPPQVARPHSPANSIPVTECEGEPLTTAYLGSCTGGKVEDFLAAAIVLKGRRVKLDTYAVPATVAVQRALNQIRLGDKSLREIFLEAGVKLGEPSCAACLGGPVDTFGRLRGDEVAISATNRNFPGRMGSSKAQIYLASPATVAASAVEGRITDPRRLVDEETWRRRAEIVARQEAVVVSSDAPAA
ncbi:MAG: aconitase/3-isopropylmalate dehydratase large subunit family protein [candidate division KSB1 bacterium]|nr:aconitase/3-isopropylmalate dehydratase large subunit family protein [candidate division KSB1 bacterium]